jgi:hypothetical protein
MECVVSAPCEYYSLRMRAFIENECRLPRNQWIYKIIDSKLQDTDEKVFLDHPQWCLCLDKHRCSPRARARARAPCARLRPCRH